MGDNTKISWAKHTFNPWYGCRHVRPGCDHCYADTWAQRGGKDFAVITRSKTWGDPRKWQRALEGTDERARVFTCSLSDFFLPEADLWRPEAWEIIKACRNLDWLILTKRPGLIPKRLPADWGERGYPNVWLGCSVENNDWLWRIPELVKVQAAVHFLSLEPLLEPLMPELADHLDDIDWVIVGGESGPKFRPMDQQWVCDIFAECKRRGIGRWFKQSAAIRSEMGTALDGELIRELPKVR